MNTLSKIWLGTILLLMAPTHCFAETLITDVTKEQAKAMGVTILARKNGDAGVKVSLKFKTKGAMKEFSGAELRMIVKGKHLVSAPLKILRPPTDSVSLLFSVAPGSLANSEFWVYVNDLPRGGSAYRFKVKDFIEVEKL